jgi:8-oxo-dGTP pyrophosphatase MutT (NUDIX family)
MGFQKVQCWIFASQDEKELSPKCLLLKTIPKRGSYWQPITGSVEVGEGYFEAACREPYEETKLYFDSPPIDVGFEFQYASQYGVVKERVFALLIPNPQPVTIDPIEHQDYTWVTPLEALKMLRFPSNKEGLKKAYFALFKKPLINEDEKT